jgi:hypothetical protein
MSTGAHASSSPAKKPPTPPMFAAALARPSPQPIVMPAPFAQNQVKPNSPAFTQYRGSPIGSAAKPSPQHPTAPQNGASPAAAPPTIEALAQALQNVRVSKAYAAPSRLSVSLAPSALFCASLALPFPRCRRPKPNSQDEDWYEQEGSELAFMVCLSLHVLAIGVVTHLAAAGAGQERNHLILILFTYALYSLNAYSCSEVRNLILLPSSVKLHYFLCLSRSAAPAPAAAAHLLHKMRRAKTLLYS